MSPETKLFRAVICQAMTDAASVPVYTEPSPIAKNGKRFSEEHQTKRVSGAKSRFREAIKTRDDARDWLTKNTEEFREVCGFAELCPDMVMSMAKKMEADGWRLQNQRGIEAKAA